MPARGAAHHGPLAAGRRFLQVPHPGQAIQKRARRIRQARSHRFRFSRVRTSARTRPTSLSYPIRSATWSIFSSTVHSDAT